MENEILGKGEHGCAIHRMPLLCNKKLNKTNKNTGVDKNLESREKRKE